MTEQASPSSKKRTKILPILIIVGVLACVALASLMIMGPIVGNTFSKINSSLVMDADMNSYLVSAPEAGQPSAETTAERIVIRTGDISLVVEDTLAAQEKIEKMVSEMEDEGAFVVSNQMNNYGGGAPSIQIVIRVPAKKFNKTMDDLSALAVKVESRTEAAEDVTAEYVDLQSRLEALETARNRLLQIIENSATTEDLLLAEQQLTAREAEIESIKGQMKYLSESARLSKISINLTTYELNKPVADIWNPAETASASFKSLLRGLRNFADFLIVFAISVLPWLLFFGGIAYGVYRFVNRRAK
jgi:hypothetical protein